MEKVPDSISGTDPGGNFLLVHRIFVVGVAGVFFFALLAVTQRCCADHCDKRPCPPFVSDPVGGMPG